LPKEIGQAKSPAVRLDWERWADQAVANAALDHGTGGDGSVAGMARITVFAGVCSLRCGAVLGGLNDPASGLSNRSAQAATQASRLLKPFY